MHIKTLLIKSVLTSYLALALLTTTPFSAPLLGAVGANLDLFTQKTPFSGAGLNQSSDAFQQQELVILYSLVTFGGDPIANKVVGYEVNGPNNTLQNITIIGSAVTNASGIAQFAFRMPTAPINMEKVVFGQWFAIATVDVDEVVVNDTLTFEVGWLIRIKSVIALDNQLSPQTAFPLGSPIIFGLTLENIGLTARNATLTVYVEDVLGHPIIFSELDDQNIPPGESFALISSQIPENAEPGTANVTASAYTGPPVNGGVAYSPAVYTTFDIVKGELHDVAVTNVSVSSTQVQAGENVDITVEAANLGDFAETFNIVVYYDSSIIEVIPVIALSPASSKTSAVTWNTANVNPGVYRISANATVVRNDINPVNNNFLDGDVTVVSKAIVPLPESLRSLLLVIVLAIIAGLAFFMMLILFLCRRRRRRRNHRKSNDVILVHPHI